MYFKCICMCFALSVLSSFYVDDINNTFWEVPDKAGEAYSLHCGVSKPERTIPLFPLAILVTNKKRKNYDFYIGLLSRKDSSIVKVNKVNYTVHNLNNDTLIYDSINDVNRLEKITRHMIISDKRYDIPILEEKELGDSIFVTANFWFQLRNDSSVYKKEFNCTLVKDQHRGFSRLF